MRYGFKKALSKLPFLRTCALWMLRSLRRDINLKNPWTGDRLFLNSYTHKGYWFYRRSRERLTMDRFASLIDSGDTVLDVGGHIGYISQWFAKLVGPTGRVVVFEPGTNNLRYIRRNTSPLLNVVLETSAVSDTVGTSVLFEDAITGQNNSMLSDYQNLDGVAASHGVEAHRTSRPVSTITLDEYVDRAGITVDFIKLDIEGHELYALRGAVKTLINAKAVMVEVTENSHEVAELLQKLDFTTTDASGSIVTRLDRPANYFALNNRFAR